jgi:nicotinamide-nucleotide amidase
MIANTCGTAPGLQAKLNRAYVFVTPGVPREMKAMYNLSIEPALRVMLDEQARREGKSGPRVILTTKVNTFGMGESDVAERLGDLMQRGRNPTVGTTVSDGFCGVRIRAEFDDKLAAQAALDNTATRVESALGGIVFGRDEDTLQGSVIALLKQQGKTVVTAESCTGGLIGAMLTDVPGSSAAYLGGWVTYSYLMKESALGVDEITLRQYGAVSEQVARLMADNARQLSGAHFALSVTGIAGPDGGTADKPVGTVWIGLSSRDKTEARVANLVGNRAAVRDRSAKCALQWLRLSLMGLDNSAIRWMK